MELLGYFISLANAVRDDQSEENRLGKRINLIIQYFKEIPNIDFIVFSEARLCKNEDGTDFLTPLQIALKFGQELNMYPIMQANNDQALSFSKIILFNPTKLFLLETSSVWPTLTGEVSNTPTGLQFCQSITEAKFYLKTADASDNRGHYNTNLNRSFTLGAIHTPLLDGGRDNYFKMMINNYENADPAIFIGDYNLLPDMKGPEHEELLNQHFTNFTKDIGTTFIGFPNDVDPEGNPWMSSLDRVYANKAFIETFGQNVQTSVENVTIEGKRLSDHFIMRVKINFSLVN
jgi:hypothetical protein